MAPRKNLRDAKGGEEDFSKIRLPHDGQILGYVEKRLGGSRMKVRIEDGSVIMAKVPGRAKKFLWVREKDIVLLEMWQFDKTKADLVYKYKPAEVNYLRKKGFTVDFDVVEEF